MEIEINKRLFGIIPIQVEYHLSSEESKIINTKNTGKQLNKYFQTDKEGKGLLTAKLISPSRLEAAADLENIAGCFNFITTEILRNGKRVPYNLNENERK